MNAPNQDHQSITVQGLVIASQWDLEGNPVKVQIATFDDQEYLVDDTQLNGELHHFIHKKVEISGIVAKTGRGPSIVNVSRLRILEDTTVQAVTE